MSWMINTHKTFLRLGVCWPRRARVRGGNRARRAAGGRAVRARGGGASRRRVLHSAGECLSETRSSSTFSQRGTYNNMDTTMLDV